MPTLSAPQSREPRCLLNETPLSSNPPIKLASAEADVSSEMARKLALLCALILGIVLAEAIAALVIDGVYLPAIIVSFFFALVLVLDGVRVEKESK